MGVRIRERDGAWWIFVCHQGRRKAKRIGPGDAGKKAAKEAAGKIQGKLALGDVSALEPTEKPLTLQAYADQWLKVYAHVHCKPGTIQNYERFLRRHVYPTLGDVSLNRLTRAQVKAWIAERLENGNLRSTGKPLNPRTMGTILIPLRAALASAVDDGLLVANPAARMGRFTVNREGTPTEKADPFTDEELRHLLATCREQFPQGSPLLLTLARTGVRIGEAAGLMWEDVDLDRGFLWVRRGYSKGRMSTPKSGKGRCVDMSRQLQAALTDSRGAKTVEATVQGTTPSPWVFGGLDGKPMDYEQFTRRVWTPLLTLAGLRYRGIHQLRHTWASLLLMQGESPAYVSKQAGHSSIKITVDLYGHWIPGANRQAMDRLDDPKPVLPATGCNPAATVNDSIPVSTHRI
jgi:integrase